jgi:hypothetical protein
MSQFSLPLTQLIHENLLIVMNFAFSRRPLEQLVKAKFVGEWKYLRKALFSMSEQRAAKACIELAIFMRLLDDQENISGYLKKTGERSFGHLIMRDKSDKRLKLREVANKILHASDLEWNFSTENNPILVCHSRKTEKWVRAEIKVIASGILRPTH